ncbi:MAG: ABC transporter permease [Candidatus Thorarchaeota archaeon]
MTVTVPKPSLGSHWSVTWNTFIIRLKTISRYKGSLLMDILLPLFFATMPILLGQAMAGSIEAASANFRLNTGFSSANYVAYMIIGANVFASVLAAFWLLGFYIRREQLSGTLEPVFMTPANRLSVFGGIVLYIQARTTFTFLAGYFLGCLLYSVNPLQEGFLAFILAYLILMVGLIPVFGLSFLMGAVTLKVKQANSLFNTLQWFIGILMGAFIPITVLPAFIQILALLFPGYYLNYTVQATLTGLDWFFGSLYLDVAVLFIFALICVSLGYRIFDRSESRSKRAEGIGQF